MRFYQAYTFDQILEMRSRQFFALNKQITGLVKEEEARQLSITHNSKPGDRIKEIVSDLNYRRRIKTVAESAQAILQQGEAGGFASRVAAAEIDAVRERQKAAAKEMEQDRDAWLNKLKSQLAAEQATKAQQP
jgi:hypothetical protein